jgi:hypothetical protein
VGFGGGGVTPAAALLRHWRNSALELLQVTELSREGYTFHWHAPPHLNWAFTLLAFSGLAAEAVGASTGLRKSVNPPRAGLVRGVRLIKETRAGWKGTPVTVFISVETSQLRGKAFRLAMRVSLPLPLVWAALRSVGLI